MEIEKRILIVEDDEKSASYLKDALEIYAYSVTIAYNGKSGLDYFLENPFPVIISDLEMPYSGGRELISNLAEVTIPPVILVQTAHNEANIMQEILNLGVFDYLIKPIRVKELVSKVASAFEAYAIRQS